MDNDDQAQFFFNLKLTLLSGTIQFSYILVVHLVSDLRLYINALVRSTIPDPNCWV